MIFEILGLDIAIILIGLNVLTIVTFMIKSLKLKKYPQEQQEKIKKNKNQTEEAQQTKITVNNQTSTLKKNGSTFKNIQPNETDQTNRQRMNIEHHPQSSGLIYSPQNKNNENDNLMPSSNRQTQRVSIIPILSTQIQHTNGKSSMSQNVIQDGKQQQDLNKSIINQLKDASFVHSKIVQCKQCRADDSVEPSDDIVTIERKRNMSIPSELKDGFEKGELQQRCDTILPLCQQQKQEQSKKFLYSQNTFLFISSLFFIQSLMMKINEDSNFYTDRNITDDLESYLITACFGAAFYNIFYGFILFLLEKLFKINKIIIRIMFFCYNVSMPFYIFTTITIPKDYVIKNIQDDLNLEFLVILGFNYLLQIFLETFIGLICCNNNLKQIIFIFDL